MSSQPAARLSPAADRNKAPILAELQRLLPARGRLLEIAAGTGQHAVHFAAGLPGWTWQPTDPSPDSLDSIAAWSAQQPSPDLQPPLLLDVLAEPWPLPAETCWDAIYCANLLHIAPWACCAALMRGAARLLAPEGRLIVYGPFLVQGEAIAPGNQAFDADLRMRDPRWGIRWLHDVVAQAADVGLTLRERIAMPANNLLLVFGRAR
jgi:SAM-dependent methyltransferase